MIDSSKVKLSEGEALKNKNSKGSDNKIQVWIPKATIEYEEEKHKLQIELLNYKLMSERQGSE